MKFDNLPRGIPGTNARSGGAPRALWMSSQTLKNSNFWTYKSDKIVLGALDGFRVGISDNRHLMTVAGSRAGKGTSAIIPNLLLYPGSVLVVDPKGENATETAERRGQGRGIKQGGLNHDVFVLDPFEVADVDNDYRAGFNPFSSLDPKSKHFIDDCDSIADALIIAESGKEHDHWNGSARIVLRGFIAWVAESPDVQSCDLNELRRLLYLAPASQSDADMDDVDDIPESFNLLIAVMAASDEIASGVPAEAARMLLGMEDRERGSVMSTVRQNLSFLSSPPMAECLSGKQRSPDLRKWKFGGQTVYLCLPAGRLHRHNRFLRLFINQLLAAIEYEKKTPKVPALMILDEMHVLGHMHALETAAGLIAGYGVRIWSIWQDLNQLKQLYKTRWETFMGNSGILQFFGLNDLTSLEYVSKRLGTSSVMSISKSQISQQQAVQGFSGESKSIQAAPLLSPDEVAYFFSRQSGNQLVLYPGTDPIFMQRLPYYDDVYREYRSDE